MRKGEKRVLEKIKCGNTQKFVSCEEKKTEHHTNLDGKKNNVISQ